jgi:hypothetical protein
MPNVSPTAEGSGDAWSLPIEVSAHREIVNRNPNRKGYAINRIAEQQTTV